MSNKRQREPEQKQHCSVDCDCGHKHRFNLAHYQIGHADCGRFYWALQPRRNGPFKLSIWPGPNFTRQEMEGKA